MQPDSPKYTLSKERFEAFSDGVFAIAITLLALEIHLPAGLSKFSANAAKTAALLQLWPQYLVYVASFATIGIMWLNHHALFRYCKRITHGIVIANLFLLMVISFLPFSTAELGQFGITRPAVVYYGLVLILIAFGYLFVHQQVLAAENLPRRLTTWNIVGLSLYPLATLLGYFVPLAGIFGFVALALFYMLPRNVQSIALE
ncbi:MAG: DUF1211 domain-containing protein [Candidatus Eremiobacteraeota bacterium]|nr:DUF1211 domain-containing protein [Candidatus Eremiobacteraeota bacterium]